MNTENDWDIVVKPKDSLFRLNLKEVWAYRDLILLMVKRDLTATGLWCAVDHVPELYRISGFHVQRKHSANLIVQSGSLSDRSSSFYTHRKRHFLLHLLIHWCRDHFRFNAVFCTGV